MYANNGAYHTPCYYYQNPHWYQTQVPFYHPNGYNGNVGALPQQNVAINNNMEGDVKNVGENVAQSFETIHRVSSEVVNCDDSGDDSGYGAFKRQLGENLKFFRLDGLKANGFFLSGNIVHSSRK